MEYKEFKNDLSEKSNKIGLNMTEDQIKNLYTYMNLLLEWNNHINLTAITQENEIILKHFIDSLTIHQYIGDKQNVLDIGTGAGFPGVPLKIIKEETNFILVDSLNKRIHFLEEVKNKLGLKKIELIHSRAEDLAKDNKYRENVDIAVSRAVANLRVLVEYMLPFVKVGGKCICMKGPNLEEEINESKNAIKILGGKIEKVETIFLPESDIERNIVIIKKIEQTSNKYPRKAGTPIKQPL